ncbi:MAG: 30S ribosomal protein S20 [Spirochaetes bacterium]|nr:30S ribosomal protein S20 [Spirochaetota bacterium]
MANTKSTEKRIRQNEKHRRHNSAIKSSLRTSAKKVLKTISASSNIEELKENYKQFAKRMDTAARKRIIHKNAAARKKSRIARRMNAAAKKSS